MIKFKMYCPKCSAMVVTENPQVIIWELCPGCNSHIWDMTDALMAEIMPSDSRGREVRPGMATQ